MALISQYNNNNNLQYKHTSLQFKLVQAFIYTDKVINLDLVSPSQYLHVNKYKCKHTLTPLFCIYSIHLLTIINPPSND